MAQNFISVVDLKAGYIAYRAEIDAAIARVLESGWYVLGQECSNFEKAFAHWCGAAHAIGVANGTDALVVALKALGVNERDAVFTVSHTAVATVAAIELAGASPVLVDIEPDLYTLDPAKLEEAVIECARVGRLRPKAVVAVHIYGQVCDMVALQVVCQRHDLKLVEDCAQAHGATLGGKPVGAFGSIGTFSFYPTKNLGAYGDGGAIVTADAELAEMCGALRQYGWFKHYHSDVVGQNSRLDELQAAILSVKLRHLPEELKARRKIAEAYNAAFDAPIVTPKTRAGTEHAYHLYVVRSPVRDALAQALKARGIATAIHYPTPVHRQKAYEGRIAIGPGGLPVTESLYREILSLPMHPFLSQDDMVRVINAVKKFAAA